MEEDIKDLIRECEVVWERLSEPRKKLIKFLKEEVEK